MFYKVVAEYEGLISACAVYKELRVRYQIGRPVSSPIGPLFVFDSYGAARDFQHDTAPDLQIWECEIEPSAQRPRKMAYMSGLNALNVAEFWANDCEGYAPPRGTVLAKSVTLIKRVDENE